SAELAAWMRRRNACAEIAEPKPLRHRGEPADLTPDADGRKNPDAGEQQQRCHREDGHILVKPAVCGGDQSVLGPSDHDIEAGLADRRRASDGPDLRGTVAVGYLARRLAIRGCREAEQLRARDRRADGMVPATALGSDQHGALAVD